MRLHALGFRSYAEYLRSDHWKERRRQYRASSLPQECLACRSKDFHLHHRSYARIGAELLSDLIPLCGSCHRRVHDYERLHGTRIQETHVIMRRVFGWTKGQTHARFALFCMPGSGHGYRWVTRGKVPSKAERWAVTMSPEPRPKPPTINPTKKRRKGRDSLPADVPLPPVKLGHHAGALPPLGSRVRKG